MSWRITTASRSARIAPRDNNPATIEVFINGLSNATISLGTTTVADGEFKWNSVNTNKVTLAIAGVQGISTLGQVKGGRIAFNELNSVLGLSMHVDKIIIQGSSLILPLVGTQGGVPIEIGSGGSLDIGNVVGNVIDGPVTVKTGGVFFFNDAQVLGGTGAITFEDGSVLDISGAAPATFFSAATNPLVFTATQDMTARFAASDITNLDARIPNLRATYEVAGGGTAAIIADTNLSVTTNTQTAGITIENGILTNDGTSRGFSGPITLNNTNFTVAASRGTSLGITNAIATTGSVNVGSATAIDGRDKNTNPDRVSGLGLADPYNSSPQVVFVGPFNVGGTVTATSTHLAFGTAPLHTVNVGVRIVNDGNNGNIDGIIRSDRHNDSTVIADTQVSTITVDAGARLQTVSVNQARLTLPSITLGAGSGIDSTNNTSVFIGDVVGGANAIRFTGQAPARIFGNVTASAVTVVGAGLDIDPGTGNTTAMIAPVSLSGVLSVRTGTLDLGTNVITGAATSVVPGLRENKTQGAFDLTSSNTSNQIQLGPVMAQLPANAWGENQTVTYTGRINIPDNGTLGDGLGSVAFAKIFDDSMRIRIDGVTYFQSTAFNDAVASGAIPLTTGLHDIEIRLGQGVGGAGPVVSDGGAFGIGLGIDLTDPVDNSQMPGVGNVLDLSQYIIPLDNGSGSLFETTTVKGGINVAGDTTLKAGAFTNIGTVNMAGFNSVIGVTANSDADALIVGAAATSYLSGTTGVSFTFGSLDIGAGATLHLTNPPPPSPAEAAAFDGEAGELTGPAAVPEPGSAVLLLAGIASLLSRRRR